MSLSQELPRKERHGAYITTLSGKLLDLHDPSPDDITIEDIATGLSNNCRFSGQLPVHYSVAAHSIVLADLMDNQDAQLYALLHDASEAYIMDMPRPVKMLCPDYSEIERRIQDAVMQKFYPDGNLSAEDYTAVHSLDRVMPAFEQIALMGQGNVCDWVWDTLHSAYTGSSLQEEMQRVIPLIKEAMMAGPFIKVRYLAYIREFIDDEA